MFSVAKYPAPENVEEYRSLFAGKTERCEMKHSKFKLVNKMQNHPSDQDMRDKHRFYSVKVGSQFLREHFKTQLCGFCTFFHSFLFLDFREENIE